MEIPETTIAQIANTAGSTTAGRLRQALAIEAISDPTWVAIDRRRRKAGIIVAERRPIAPLVLLEHLSENVSEIVAPKKLRLFTEKPIFRTILFACIGIFAGILIMINPLTPLWYRSWSNLGPAVGITGVTFVTLVLSLMYSIGTEKFPKGYRNVLDFFFLTYAAVALHLFLAATLLFFGLIYFIYKQIEFRRNALREKSRINALVNSILESPLIEQKNDIQIRWGRFTGTPAQAADLLCARSFELDGFDLSTEEPWLLVDRVVAERDVLDTFASVLAAELWLLACDATEFEQAASIGPAALGAYAAILARSRGDSIQSMPAITGEEAWPSTLYSASAKIALFKNVVESSCGPESFDEVAMRAASDLSWGGGGDDRCARMGRLLTRLASHRSI
jgi:hypothetical protein